MPELPEVETTRVGLLAILGQVVTAVEVRQPRLRQQVPTELTQIIGRTCRSLQRRGKYLI